MTPEEQKEFDELNKYKEFVNIFFDYIDEINYDEKTKTMNILFSELVLDTKEINLFVDKENADKLYELFTLLEQENDIQQDEVGEIE